tara:strand:- start:915 stop:2321 length:1407 start_codon:yes stop_codon:yes gene_type:complete
MKHDGKSTGLFQEEEEDYNLEEETKYKLKLDAPQSEPAFGGSDGDDESLDAFDDAEGDNLSFGDDEGGDEKPFDDEPFDAGVETDEDEDPEKFIQQLSGKLGTSLRKYNDERDSPDFDLEKYAINSVISATHTSEMDEEDQKDIIRKVKTSGADDDNDDIDKDLDIDSEEPKDEEGDSFEDEVEEIEEKDLDEGFDNENYYVVKYKYDENSYTEDVVTKDELKSIDGLISSKGPMSKKNAEMVVSNEGGGDDEYDSEEDNDFLYEDSWSNPMEVSEGVEVSGDLQYHLDNKISLGEGLFRYGSDAYIKLYTEVKTLNDLNAIKLNENDEELIKDFTNQSVIIEGERILLNLIVEDNGSSILEEESKDRYKGKKSNSPTRGASGGKAYKVFVPGCNVKTKSNPRGIKKIQFGSGGLKAKLSNKEAKKSYNARHGCAKGNHNDKCKAGYWSCRLPRYAKSLGLSGGGTWW